MNMIEKYEFGFFIVDKKWYDGDLIIVNNQPFLRIGHSHSITEEEIKKLIIASKTKCLIIGTGYSGGASLDTKASKLLHDAGVRLIIGKTQDIFKRVNTTENGAAILHATC